ncbi:thiamine pyrophosphate-dependent enzyme [Vibrio chagasii]|nr:thiamine pyrophosphate-dependent enzyme [Vibrio chagasii]
MVAVYCQSLFDSAIAGQGVVQETLTCQARGFCRWYEVRIVVNNQVGFTTSNPRDTRSTMYCTDIAKIRYGLRFHVNADDQKRLLLLLA